jgi:CRP-like cAMP-binding protein
MQITTEWLPAEGALRPVSDASMPVSDIVAPPFRNQLLAGLTQDELAQLRPSLTPVELARNQVLFRSGEPVEHVYFVEQGMVSLLMEPGAGQAGIEVGMVGPEGMAGFSTLLGVHPIALHHTAVQVPGSALQMPLTFFRDCLDCMPALRERCLSYLSTVIIQISQTAACMGRHHLDERCADRLLAACDRIESHNLPLTHSTLAAMLGVRRAGVTVTVGRLQNAGLVRCGRGHIEVLDHAGLERVACGCSRLVRDQFDRLLACS